MAVSTDHPVHPSNCVHFLLGSRMRKIAVSTNRFQLAGESLPQISSVIRLSIFRASSAQSQKSPFGKLLADLLVQLLLQQIQCGNIRSGETGRIGANESRPVVANNSKGTAFANWMERCVKSVPLQQGIPNIDVESQILGS